MQCPHCGTSAASSSVYCGRCGARLMTAPDLPAASGDLEVTRPPSSKDGASANAGDVTPPPLAPGTPFGARYRILRRLGQGGMGVVYQAWDDELGLAVALKVIKPQVLSDPAEAD